MEYPSTSGDRSRVEGRLGNMREDIEDNKYGVVCQLLCIACLCSDRNLQPLKHDSLLRYNTFVNGSQLSNTISVCWECGARLKKIVQFRQRVVECYDILVRGDHGCEVSYQPLLQIYKNDDVDIQPQNTSDLHREANVESVLLESPINKHAQHGTQDIKNAFEIKIEPEEIMVKSAFDSVMIKIIKVESQNLFESGTKETAFEAGRLFHCGAEKIKSETIENVTEELECLTDSNTDTCMACLCVSRKLHYVVNIILKQYYIDILEQKQVPHDYVTLGLCFECLSILKTSICFEDQLRNSYQILLSSLSTLETQDITSLLCSGVSLPPRLRRCVRDRVDIPPHAHTQDPPPPVKLEPDSPGLGDSSPPPAGHVQRTDEPAAEVKHTSRRDTTHVTTSNITSDRRHRECTSKQQLISNTYPHNTSVCEDNSHVLALQDLRIPKQGAHKHYQCNHCKKTFKFKSRLIYHMRRHTAEKPHQCSQCSKAYVSKYRLARHMMTHSAENLYQCSQCTKAFTFKESLVRHMTTHSGAKPYQCSQCSKEYYNKNGLVRHMKTHSADRPYQCSQCSMAHISNYHLAQHMITHSGEKPYQCSQCSKAYKRKNDLVHHMKTHSAERPSPYQCSQCTKAYASKQSLVCHMTKHSGDKPYQCSQCTKAYTSKHNVARHMMITHSAEKPYQCSQCIKAYTSKESLVCHMTTHSGDKPYQCSQCSKAYDIKHHLARHMITHSGEKPYRCSQCTKEHTSKHHLSQHMTTHSGEKPYQCSQCSKAYKRKNDLGHHMKTHSAERPSSSVQSVYKGIRFET